MMVKRRRNDCPKCGSTHIDWKEYYLGAQTGDSVCKDCGYAAPSDGDQWLMDEEEATDDNAPD